MQEKIKKILSSYNEKIEWNLFHTIKHQDEVYLVRNDIESQRKVCVDDYSLTIYVMKEVNGEKKTGWSYQDIPRNASESEIRTCLDKMLFSASLSLNQYFELDEFRESEEEYLCHDKELWNDKNSIINVKELLMQALEKNKNIRLASSEILLSKAEVTQYNSKGLLYYTPKTFLTIEAVMLAGEGVNEVESHLIRDERFLKNMDIEDMVSRYSNYALESINADLPVSGKYNVIFTEEALDNFFDYYVNQVSAGTIYNNRGKFKLNDLICENVRGELLTLGVDPALPGGIETRKYDTYGTLLKPATFIQNNQITSFSANKQFAQYLQYPVTGGFSNLIVKEGKQSYQEMLEDNTMILSRFSTFNPNSSTGAFSGEIRNGLLYSNGKFTPIKGGSVTGTMDKAFKEVYFSKEKVQRRGYFGPRWIKMNNLDIAGN